MAMRGGEAEKYPHVPPAREERSLGELIGEFADEMRVLFRQELDLARTEMSRKASKAIRNIAFLAIGGAVIYAGFLALVGAAILALSLAISLGWSALVIGVIMAAVGAFLMWKGFEDLRREDWAPRQTLRTLKEDATWAKDRMK